MNLPSLSELSSASLTSSISDLRRQQRGDDVQFLWLLAEIERRQSFVDLAYASLWDYCTAELRLTNGAAGRRISAARLLARFPAAADFLYDGRLGLTTFGMLRDVLTNENHLALFEAASCKSEREVDELVRTHCPLSFSRDTVIRTVRAPGTAPTPAPGVTTVAPSLTAPPVATPSAPATTVVPALAPPPVATPPARIRAVDADYVSLTIRVPKAFMDDLDQVSAALSHIVPSRKPADVLHECIARTLVDAANRKGGLPARRNSARNSTPDSARCAAPNSQNSSHVANSDVTTIEESSTRSSAQTPSPEPTSAPASPPRSRSSSHAASSEFTPAPGVESISDSGLSGFTPAPGVESISDSGLSGFTPAPGVEFDADSRSVPRAVARAVWERDGGCCTFVGSNGRRCRSTHQLELHHRIAFALGGQTSADNLTLHCRRHNAREAQREFGSTFMSQFGRAG